MILKNIYSEGMANEKGKVPKQLKPHVFGEGNQAAKKFDGLSKDIFTRISQEDYNALKQLAEQSQKKVPVSEVVRQALKFALENDFKL